jgi:hypothetical protein
LPTTRLLRLLRLLRPLRSVLAVLLKLLALGWREQGLKLLPADLAHHLDLRSLRLRQIERLKRLTRVLSVGPRSL